MSSHVLVLRTLRRGAIETRRPRLLRHYTLLRLHNSPPTFTPFRATLSLENRHFTTSNGSSTLQLTMKGGQLTDVAAAAVDSSTSHEPWAIVQGVQSILETVHLTTGLPWWTVLLLSGVTVRAAIFPLYVLQIHAMQR
ncbi:hypothetical protein CCR75_009071 [Bremia lactucae]|uniref:Uncharacterized protein n=1 Tax=Bremia lactucae TaxID=4779 RepID=A0A976FPW9_BRELC|nr:hypothetical protein CCR75_009071 [Bremia lactucae]